MGLLGWALIVLVVAGVAALFGFGGVATAAAGVAKLVFFLCLAVFLALLIAGMFLSAGTPTA
jgi:uncharacterized membrane protein YtjA (UPF0391 family)